MDHLWKPGGWFIRWATSLSLLHSSGCRKVPAILLAHIQRNVSCLPFRNSGDHHRKNHVHSMHGFNYSPTDNVLLSRCRYIPPRTFIDNPDLLERHSNDMARFQNLRTFIWTDIQPFLERPHPDTCKQMRLVCGYDFKLLVLLHYGLQFSCRTIGLTYFFFA